jgi:hypothetical protein
MLLTVPVTGVRADVSCLDPMSHLANFMKDKYGDYNSHHYFLAYDELRPKAENGDAVAQAMVGKILKGVGNLAQYDEDEAAKFFLLAAKQGNYHAMGELGIHYEIISQPDFVEAFYWYRMALLHVPNDCASDKRMMQIKMSNFSWRLTDVERQKAETLLRSRPLAQTSLVEKQSTRQSDVMRSDGVRDIQAALAALGYNPGPVDGIMGSKTRTAIRAFQRDEKLTVDGKPSDALLAHLRNPTKASRKTSTEKSSGKSTTSSSTSPSAGFSPLLESNRWNDADLNHQLLEAIQTVIRTSGYRCDSFTRTGSLHWGRHGYWVRCNRDRYKYEIEDQGGNLVVILK